MRKVAVVIGHDKTSPGAYSKHLGMSEYIYNSEVASHLPYDIFKRPMGVPYKTQMQMLAKQVVGYDLVIELHFNAFNNSANGCETVSYPGNKITEALGKEYCRLITNHFCNNNRGAKIATSGGRGWWFLYYMPANAIIVEPFFGDAPEALLFKNPKEYAKILVDWIENSIPNR